MNTILNLTRRGLLTAVAAGMAALLCLPAPCVAGNKPDFNGDGYADLAIGAPGESLVFLGVNQPSAGAVNVIYGSAAGLNAVAPVANQFWHQAVAGMPENPEPNDGFGRALAWGDFNGDGYSDLAIGVPGENGYVGAVDVIYGSVIGLNAFTPVPAQHWTQSLLGAVEQGLCRFGWVVAAGDFNKDGYQDLAVGLPNENVGAAVDAGDVIVLYGSSQGLRVAAAPDGTGRSWQEWNQDSGSIIGICEAYDHFGAALTTGDFNKDGYADLAVGVPNEDAEPLGGGAAIQDVGAVNVLYGSSQGLRDAPAPDGTGKNNDWWWQNSSGIVGVCEGFDYFGHSLAAGDFNKDGYDDLAVGVPNEDVEAGGVVTANAGAVNVIPGSAAGLTATGSQWWWQESTNIDDASEANDYLGTSVTVGDFNGDGYADLAIGAPGESNVGAVNVVFGSSGGLRATPAADGTGCNDQLWHQDSAGILDVAEANDAFGWSLTAADFNGDKKDDLSVGVVGEDIVRAGVTYVDAGAVNVIYGSAVGLTAAGNQFWNQDSPNILDIVEPYDGFSGSVYGP